MNKITHIEQSGNMVAEAYELLRSTGAIALGVDVKGDKIEIHFYADEFMSLGLNYDVKQLERSDHDAKVYYQAKAKFDSFNIFCILTESDYQRYVKRKAASV